MFDIDLLAVTPAVPHAHTMADDRRAPLAHQFFVKCRRQHPFMTPMIVVLARQEASSK